MVPGENKAKRLSLVNHATKTINHHHHSLKRILMLLISCFFFVNSGDDSNNVTLGDIDFATMEETSFQKSVNYNSKRHSFAGPFSECNS